MIASLCARKLVLLVVALALLMHVHAYKRKESVKRTKDGSPAYVRDERYREWARRAHNETRTRLVNETLHAAAGVYKDKAKGAAMGLQKTVFITMIEYLSGHFHYKVYFRNFLCYARHHGYDLIVFVVSNVDTSSPSASSEIEHELRGLEELGVRALTFPDELFWQLVYGKSEQMFVGPLHAKYKSTHPGFGSEGYGALPMLVPVYEVLLAGFNVIYFDVDTGLVQDPVPHLIRGDADFVSSIENRVCLETYYSSKPASTDWERVEPNTGIMHLRSTPQGIAFVTTWLEKIVDQNLINDQRVLDRRDENATYVSNCLPEGTLGANMSVPSIRKFPESATYCFLHEVQFQNGIVGIQCGSKRATREAWLLTMYHEATAIDDVRYPVVVHANFCNAKTHELEIRGLWLYLDKGDHNVTREGVAAHHRQRGGHGPRGGGGVLLEHAGNATTTLVPPLSSSEEEEEISCAHFNITNTYYYKGVNWKEEVGEIMKRRDEVLQEVLKNNTLIKRVGGDEIFRIDEHGLKHSFPDSDTFLGMGLEWDQIKTIPTAVMALIKEGSPFPSMATETSESTLRRKKLEKDEIRYLSTHKRFYSPNIIPIEGETMRKDQR